MSEMLRPRTVLIPGRTQTLKATPMMGIRQSSSWETRPSLASRLSRWFYLLVLSPWVFCWPRITKIWKRGIRRSWSRRIQARLLQPGLKRRSRPWSSRCRISSSSWRGTRRSWSRRIQARLLKLSLKRIQARLLKTSLKRSRPWSSRCRISSSSWRRRSCSPTCRRKNKIRLDNTRRNRRRFRTSAWDCLRRITNKWRSKLPRKTRRSRSWGRNWSCWRTLLGNQSRLFKGMVVGIWTLILQHVRLPNSRLNWKTLS